MRGSGIHHAEGRASTLRGSFRGASKLDRPVYPRVPVLEERAMPRTRSLGWAELKIGLLTVFALAMAAILIFLLSSTGGLWWQRYPLKTIFDNVAGLGEGAPV